MSRLLSSKHIILYDELLARTKLHLWRGGQNRIEILLGLAEGRPTYACVLPMILSYLCLWATLQKSYRWFWASLVPMPLATYTFNLLYLYLCLPMLSGFWATYVFRLPMLSRYQCSWATYVFELPMPSCYLCFWSCSQASFSDACAFELPMSSVFLCFRGTNAVELLMPSGYICFWATHVFKLPMLLTTYISEPLCFQSTNFV